MLIASITHKKGNRIRVYRFKKQKIPSHFDHLIGTIKTPIHQTITKRVLKSDQHSFFFLLY